MNQPIVEIELPGCTLKYSLFENEFVERWLLILQHELEVAKIQINNGGDFYGSALHSESELRAKMQLCVDIVNYFRPGSITTKIYENMSQFDLMILHKDFERLEPNPEYRHAPGGVSQALTELNINIHRYESLGGESLSHIDISPRPVNRFKFRDDDYRLFSPKLQSGFLYLAYGVTGVPPLVAYKDRMDALPVPQRNVTAGMSLYFRNDLFDHDTNHLKNWFQSKWNLDSSDPKTAIGAIPLGKLLNMDQINDLIQRIIKDPRILNIRVTPAPDLKQFSARIERLEGDPIAGATLDLPTHMGSDEICKSLETCRVIATTWPHGDELMGHLELNPYLILPVKFDHVRCFNEASSLLHDFVVHRPYDQSADPQREGKWKSLAIQGLNGDSKKTQNHDDYGVTEPEYKLTEIAERCPETLKFLSAITDLSQCQRVRFMLLEPGAKIAVHSDAKDKDVTLAINVALNMPDKCDFWTDLNADGSKNLYSRRIPIQDGTVFLLNNAPYHMVENNSDVNRIHIIIHGPLRFEQQEYLEIARRQNQIPDEKQLLNNLLFKRAYFEKSCSDFLVNKWMKVGIAPSFFNEKVAMCVLHDEGADSGIMDEATNLITMASLFPLKLEVLGFKRLQEWCKRVKQQGKRFAYVIPGGTYANSLQEFYLNSARAIRQLEKSNAVVMGHIINRPPDLNGRQVLPFMHEQTLLLDLDKWEQVMGQSKDVDFGYPYIDNEIEFPAYCASPENFHDDYTPHWLAPAPISPPISDNQKTRSGQAGWFTAFMAESLRQGFRIVNVPADLRSAKKFSYPRAGRDYQYAEIKMQIDRFLKNCADRVFVFNNENLKIMPLEGFKPKSLVSVSAGLKPFVLMKQFWGDAEPERVTFIDYSSRALDQMRRVTNCDTYDALAVVLADEYKWQHRELGAVEAERLTKESLDQVLKSEFDGRFESLHFYLRTARKANFEKCNFIMDHSSFLSVLEPHTSFIFWHSNAWDSNAALFNLSEKDLKRNYVELLNSISKKLSSEYSKIGNDSTAIFKDSGANTVTAYVTDGLLLDSTRS